MSDAIRANFDSDDAAALSVVPSVETNSPEGEALVERVRDLPAPFAVKSAARPPSWSTPRPRCSDTCRPPRR